MEIQIVECPKCAAKNRISEHSDGFRPICGRCGTALFQEIHEQHKDTDKKWQPRHRVTSRLSSRANINDVRSQKANEVYKSEPKTTLGKPKTKDGEGAFIFPDGTKYEGQFKDGEYLGAAKTAYPDDKDISYETNDINIPDVEYTEIVCQIKKILYEDADECYSIAKVKTARQQELITVTGNLLSHEQGETCRIRGYWYDHAKYGTQFRAIYCEEAFPEDVYELGYIEGERAFPEDDYYIDYDEYIQSDSWRQTRLYALQRCGNVCENCGASGRKFQMYVHHFSYSNLGNERPEDLIGLCSACHEMAHNEGLKVKRNFMGDDDPTKTQWCFIATAVYGGADCTEVQILREFRDSYMMNHSFGIVFIRFYYKIAPCIVNLIKNNSLIKDFIRKILNFVIRCLSQNNLYLKSISQTPKNT